MSANQHEHYTFIFDEQNIQAQCTYSFYVAADASLKIDLLIANADAQITLHCFLQGTGANVAIRGAYILFGEHNANVTVVQYHQAAYTSSNLLIKGVLSDSAQAHYQGTIQIDKNAHATFASQENKNILLSSRARVISIPNLQVLNNEVKCFHGSAIGTIDEEQLFYAACRGIDEALAKKLLLRSFLADVIVGEQMTTKISELIG